MELIDTALAVFRQLQPAAYVQISPFIRTAVLDPDGRGKLVPDKLIRRLALCIGTKIAKIVQHLVIRRMDPEDRIVHKRISF